MRKRDILLLLIVMIHFGCYSVDKHADVQPPYTTTHYNVILAPDLSNRLTVHKKPVSDNEIMDSMMSCIYPRIATYKRKLNQMDKYRLDIINSQQVVDYTVNANLLQIDLGKFGKQIDRINYIGPFNNNSQFKQDKVAFSKEFKRITENLRSNTNGSDIWTYLNERIDRYKVDTSKKVTSYGSDRFSNEYKNVVVLFTDGYIESSNLYSTGKMSKCLTQSMVETFRKDYNRNGAGMDMLTFLRQSGYGIIPLKNPMLKYVDILVMEVHDRSIGSSGATKSPTDYQILSVFWKEWFRVSGVKSYEFLPEVSTGSEAKDKFLKFLGVQ